MDLNTLNELRLTYPEVGATCGTMPYGYHHIGASRPIGHGRRRFEQAAHAVMRWGMQRGSGLRIQASSTVAVVDAVVLVRLGPLPAAPCRVVYLIDDENRRGFGYGTLPGHPESGEEAFSIRYDPGSDAVYAEVRAFSRPALWWSRAGGPLTRLAQRIMMRRYLRAV